MRKITSLLRILAIAASAVLIASQSSVASTLSQTIWPEFFRAVNSTSNGSGIGGSLAGVVTHIGDLGGSFDRRLIGEFDLASISGQVVDAKFSFRPVQNLTQFGDFAIILDAYLGNNVQEISDYQSPSYGTIATYQMSSLPEFQTKTFDVTALLDAAVQQNSPAFGLRFRQQVESGVTTRGTSYGSFSLAVTFVPVPEPSSIFLVGAALAALPVRRRSLRHNRV